MKGIRFPHELIESIDKQVEKENKQGDKTNFSAWVIDACKEKLDKPKG
nr:YlcI/YnfO family protein [Aggregatibacter kilianii]